MALSLDPATKVITIPQADLLPVSGTLYELDTNAFRKGVTDLLASEPYIWLNDAYIHNTEVTVAGTTFARTLEFINGFSVAFENGTYSVRLAGSNNNIFDVENGILVQNSVQVIAQNSAGLVVVESAAASTPQEIADAVWKGLVADYQNEPTTEMGAYILQQLAILDDLALTIPPLLPLIVVDFSTFIQAFPEFDSPGVDQTYVETKIAEASAILDLEAYGSDPIHNLAVLYMTAHLLAISPYGLQMQLRSDDGSTTYGKFFNERLRFLVAKRGLLL